MRPFVLFILIVAFIYCDVLVIPAILALFMTLFKQSNSFIESIDTPPAAIVEKNRQTFNEVVTPDVPMGADDKLTSMYLTNGMRSKLATDIRSNWANSNFKQYFTKEFHTEKNWWDDDEQETSLKHVLN